MKPHPAHTGFFTNDEVDMIPTLSYVELENAPDPASRVRAAFFCDHPDVIVTKKATRSGNHQRVLQCQICGGYINRPMTVDEKALLLYGLPDFDESLGKSWVQAEMEAFDLARAINRKRQPDRGPALTPEYQAYLNTPEWRRRRDAVLNRDGYTCQACG